jgi:hypothetical protein
LLISSLTQSPCDRNKRPNAEIEKFIEKITVQEEKYDLFVEIRSWKKAMETAVRLRDPDRLIEVY